MAGLSGEFSIAVSTIYIRMVITRVSWVYTLEGTEFREEWFQSDINRNV